MDAVLCLAQDIFSYLVQISKNKTSYLKIIKNLVKKLTFVHSLLDEYKLMLLSRKYVLSNSVK